MMDTRKQNIQSAVSVIYVYCWLRTTRSEGELKRLVWWGTSVGLRDRGDGWLRRPSLPPGTMAQRDHFNWKSEKLHALPTCTVSVKATLSECKNSRDLKSHIYVRTFYDIAKEATLSDETHAGMHLSERVLRQIQRAQTQQWCNETDRGCKVLSSEYSTRTNKWLALATQIVGLTTVTIFSTRSVSARFHNHHP